MIAQREPSDPMDGGSLPGGVPAPPADTPLDASVEPCPLADLIVYVRKDNTSGQVIIEATVQIIGPENKSGLTSSAGSIEFTKINPGKYKVKAYKDAHSPNPAETDVELLISEKKEVTLVLYAGPLAKIEILIGGPYKDHPYGHTALRVTTNNEDHVYDYGRYGDVWGTFHSEGEGILRIWTNFSAYISDENSLGRTTTGFTYEVPEEKAKEINRHFDGRIAGKKPKEARTSMKSYRIDDYFALGPNCTTLTLNGAKIAVPEIDKDARRFNEGRGLGWSEKAAAKVKGWPSRIFMPADLQAMLGAATSPAAKKVTIYKK